MEKKNLDEIEEGFKKIEGLDRELSSLFLDEMESEQERDSPDGIQPNPGNLTIDTDLISDFVVPFQPYEEPSRRIVRNKGRPVTPFSSVHLFEDGNGGAKVARFTNTNDDRSSPKSPLFLSQSLTKKNPVVDMIESEILDGQKAINQQMFLMDNIFRDEEPVKV